MKKHVIIFALLMFAGQIVWAGDTQTVAVVKMDQFTIYEQVFKGFADNKRKDVKLVMIDTKNRSEIPGRIREIRPDLILAISYVLYDDVFEIDDIPVVYVTLTLPQDLHPDKKNLAGVIMMVEPEKQLEMISAAFPDVKTVGLFFTANRTQDYAEKTKAAGMKLGLTVITEQVRSEDDYVASLAKNREVFDLFLMLPDVEALTGRTVDALIRFSYQFDVPVVTFSQRFMNKGAVMLIGIVPEDIGRQAWEIADRKLMGKSPDCQTHVYAQKTYVSVNKEAAALLQTRFDTNAIHVDLFF